MLNCARFNSVLCSIVSFFFSIAKIRLFSYMAKNIFSPLFGTILWVVVESCSWLDEPREGCSRLFIKGFGLFHPFDVAGGMLAQRAEVELRCAQNHVVSEVLYVDANHHLRRVAGDLLGYIDDAGVIVLAMTGDPI